VTARARVTGMTPLLIVSDFQRSLAFYQRLGFREPDVWGDPPCFAMLHRDGFELMLSLVEGDAAPRPNGTSGVWDVYLRVTDLAAEQATLAQAGVDIDKGPKDAFYDMRELELVDPDGYRWCLAQNLLGAPEGWETTLDTGRSKLRLVLRLTKAHGAFQASLDSIDQGAMNLHLSAFARDEQSLHFELPAIGASYDGTREEDGAFSGHWLQGGNRWPLVWRKVP
jgi:catechol 2,3-dioxygenase-like lactoylglutathione lyase family enzyme